MTTGKRTQAWLLAGTALLAGACSSSSSGSSDVELKSAVQDLTADPDGFTTVLRFDDSPGGVSVGQVQASGGQNAVTVTRTGSTLTVVWDARVTPGHLVRVKKSGVDQGWSAVSTSDASAPTFAITSADQDVSDLSLGGDTLEVTFSGPRVVESQAEDAASWDLVVNGRSMDLTGSAFDLDPVTQVLDVTLGPGANLHAAFSLSATGVASVADVAVAAGPVAGAATGDAVPPTLTSVVQRLDQDAAGRVVDFDFDEPMDPVFSPVPARFSLVDHPDAQGVTLVTGVQQLPADPTVLRLTFSRPVAPTYDEIAHSGLIDCHGNALGAGQEPFTSTGAANGFAAVTATTAANVGGDVIVVVTDQALDPDFAVDPARWSIDVGASTLVMADQTLAYDYLTRTLTVGLDFDMRNGDGVVVDAVGQVDVDGDDFTDQAGAVVAGGDSAPPTIASVTQNRTVDPTGYTLDVAFSEDLHDGEAQDVGNYTFDPPATLDSATILPTNDTVRIVVSDLVLTPGDVTLTVAADVDDLAGNSLGAPSGPHAVVSTDATPPSATAISGRAVEGANDDTITVFFDDDMVAAEVEDESNWAVESPLGTPFDVGGATIQYDEGFRTARVVLDGGGQVLKTGDGIQASFVSMRDVGGNTVSAGNVSGIVLSEATRPTLHTVWRADAPNDGQLTVLFSEPCAGLDDLYDAGLNPFATRFAVRDSGGQLRGYPHTANVVHDGLGVELSYGFQIALTDTLDAIGVTDLAGNVMFPAMDVPIAAADPTVPGHGPAPEVTAVSGERNDTVVIRFNVDMSPWRITDPANYVVATNPGGQAVDVGASDVAWDGGDTVTITLSGSNVQAAESYDVTLEADAENPLRSDRGMAIPGLDVATVAVDGDTAVGPTQVASQALLDVTDANSLIVVFDEAVDEAAAENPLEYDYDGGNVAVDAELLGPRVVRLTFLVPVSDGGPALVVGQTSAVDLAGNDPGGDLTLAVAADTLHPLLATADGLIEVGRGGDEVVVTFNEQIDLVTGLNAANYTVTNGSVLDLAGASLTWDSVASAVTIHLPDGAELDVTQPLTVGVAGVRDVAGNAMPAPAALGGTITGDSAAPALDLAWTNYQADGFGTLVEVLFSEDVDTAFVGEAANWSTSGAGTVDDVTVVAADHVRLHLDQPLLGGETVDLAAGLEDLARNAAGALSAEPIDPAD